jgi:ribosomal protein S18 acetylase RimI-like enzyme
MTNMTAMVRQATAEDLPRMSEILLNGFEDKFRRMLGRRFERAPHVLAELGRRWLDWQMCTMLVAEADGQPVGILLIMERDERLGELWQEAWIMQRELDLIRTAACVIGLALPHHGISEKVAYVSNFTVDAPFRRRGIGWRLLASAEEWARDKGKEALSLHVAGSNPARRLYERFGFRPEKAINSWLSQWIFDIRTWLYMVKPLTETQ